MLFANVTTCVDFTVSTVKVTKFTTWSRHADLAAIGQVCPALRNAKKKVVSLHNTTDDLKTASTSIVDLLTNKLIALNLLKSQNIFFHKIIMLMNRNLFHLKSWSLIVSDSVRKARGGNLIDRGQTFEPLGLTWRDETWHFPFFHPPCLFVFFPCFFVVVFFLIQILNCNVFRI